jgi:transposase
VQLDGLLHKGEAPVRVIKRAQVLCLLDKGKMPLDIADFLDLSRTTPYRIEKKYREQGLEAALVEPSRPSHGRLIDERQAVEILAMVCEAPPAGRARWTVRLATSEAMRRGIVKKVSRGPIWELLHEGELKPWREKNVVHPGNHPVLRGQDGGRSGNLQAPLESQGTGGVPG